MTAASTAAPQDTTATDWPSYRPYRARVTDIQQLSPHFVRVRFTGSSLHHFAEHAQDQRIKVVFPLSEQTYLDLAIADESSERENWYTLWRDLPDDRRAPFRTYTARKVDAAKPEVTVDFVVHPHGDQAPGPAAAWIASARVGDELILVGPDARSSQSDLGMDWRPGTARNLLLVGDETAVPAICGILEALPHGRRVTAFMEVPSTEDRLAIQAYPNADVTFLPRGDAQLGELLESALRAWVAANPEVVAAASAARDQELADVDVDVELLWESPQAVADDGFYAWLAGESSVIKRLRRLLVTESGVDRKRVAFMGYWRAGQAERIG